jgi:hypothetical protein
VRSLAAAYIDAKAFKLALYGFLVSAPLSHFLVGALQNAFKGKTSSRDKILQIIASNLLISPIQVSGKRDSLLPWGLFIDLSDSQHFSHQRPLSTAQAPLRRLLKPSRLDFLP